MKGILLPSQTARIRPILKAVAAATVFAFTLTTILPAGWAMQRKKVTVTEGDSHLSSDLRGLSPEEAPLVRVGLEQALIERVGSGLETEVTVTEETGDSHLVSRRQFLRVAGGGLVGSALIDFLTRIADAGEVDDAYINSALFILGQQGAITFGRHLAKEGNRYPVKTVTRESWARSLPVTYVFDAEGNELIKKQIAEEVRTSWQPESTVRDRYYRAIFSQENRSFSYGTAVAATALTNVAMLAPEGSEERRKLLVRNQEMLQALADREAFLARRDRERGKIGYSYVVAGPPTHDFSLQMGTLAWVGEAFLTYQKATADKRFQAVATHMGNQILKFQKRGVRSSQGFFLNTGLIPMGTQGEKHVEWASTEYNIDAFFFLRDLGEVTGDAQYTDASERIGKGITRYLFDKTRGRFNRGLNDPIQALDANSWGAIFLLARGKVEDAKRVRAYIDKTFRREVQLPIGEPLIGYAPYDVDIFIWSEGSFGVTLLDRRLGNEKAAQAVENSLARLQLSSGGTSDAYPASWTRSEDENFFTLYPSTAATGWKILANSETFWAPQPPSSGLEQAAPAAVVPDGQSSVTTPGVVVTAPAVAPVTFASATAPGSRDETLAFEYFGRDLRVVTALAQEFYEGTFSERLAPRRLRKGRSDSNSFWEKIRGQKKIPETESEKFRRFYSSREEVKKFLLSHSPSSSLMEAGGDPQERQVARRRFEVAVDRMMELRDVVKAAVEHSRARIDEGLEPVADNRLEEGLYEVVQLTYLDQSIPVHRTSARQESREPDLDARQPKKLSAAEATSDAAEEPPPLREVSKVNLPRVENFWKETAKKRLNNTRQLNKLKKHLSKVASANSARLLYPYAAALDLEEPSRYLEILRARVIEALANRYQFDERRLVQLDLEGPNAVEDRKRLRAKNELRRIAGLTTLEVERSWEAHGHHIYQAKQGRETLKALIIARAEEEGLMGMSVEAIAALNQFKERGVDVTVLILGPHLPETLVQQYAEEAVEQNLSYLRKPTPPAQAAHETGYVTFVAPTQEFDSLQVEHTTDPLVTWVQNRHGQEAAVGVALSLESSAHLRSAHLMRIGSAKTLPATGTLYLADAQVREGIFERKAIDERIAVEKEEREQRKVSSLAALGMGTVIGSALVGAPAVANAQSPTASSLPQLESTGALLSDGPVVVWEFDKQGPKVEINAAMNLPARVKTPLPVRPTASGPGMVSKIVIDPTGQAQATQTEIKRVLATPANFSRSPGKTALGRLTALMAGVRTQLRKTVYGNENPDTWTATTDPVRSLLLPGHRVGFTLWNPQDLEDLGQDRVDAIFQSIGKGAREGRDEGQRTRPLFLYEVNHPVTLAGAQREKGPVAQAVLAKVQSHVQNAHKNGIQVAPLYSGNEAVENPSAAVQHFKVALDQGFDPGILITDLEPWADPEGMWARARAQMDRAVVENDSRGISQARQKLLNIAILWQRTHEKILEDVIPEDRAYPESVDGLPQLYAFVQPAFVPFLKVAALWDQVQQMAQAQGVNSDEIWTAFDSVTAVKPGESWTVADLLSALKAKGLDLEESDLEVGLPPRLKLIVMAYSYADGGEAETVAGQMEMAYAGGFGGQMGLAVNLEYGTADESLADRSERAGEITEAIVKKLKREKTTTGFDGETILVHLPDDLSLMDMAKSGKLTWPRHLSPTRSQNVAKVTGATVVRLFGLPPKEVWQQHRIPKEETLREFAQRQAVTSLWGLGAGVVGIGPWYAFNANLHNWIVNDLANIHPDTGPFGAELGGGERVASVIVGALASGHARVMDTHLHLVKRGENGRIEREVTVKYIPGKNAPFISDDIWDEAELEMKVRRVGSRWGPKLFVDMAAKVENRDVATVASPREEWSHVALFWGVKETTLTIPLPPLVAGSNVITLITQDNQGRILDWVGPGQNALYLAPYAPLIAEEAADRLDQIAQELSEIKKAASLDPSEPVGAERLIEEDKQDLILGQQMLNINPLSVRTGDRAEVILQAALPDQLDRNQIDPLMERIKLNGITALEVQVPDLLKQTRDALGPSDVGLSALASGSFQGPQFIRLVEFIKIAHRHGLEVQLSINADELLQAAKEIETEELITKTVQTRRDTKTLVAALLKLILLANEQMFWNIDSIAFDQPIPDEDQRRLIERVVQGSLDVSMVVIGPRGKSSEHSLYAQGVDLTSGPAAVLSKVDQILKEPQPNQPKKGRYATGIVLQGLSLQDAVTWLSKLPTVGESSPDHPDQAALWPDRFGNRPKGLAKAGQIALMDRIRVPDARTLDSIASPTVRNEVLQKAPTVTQDELLEALHEDDPSQESEPWASAMVKAKALELQRISSVSQVERYGTPFDNVMLNLYGIQLSPLIMTEAQRAEVVPLVPANLVQENGSAWLGVQVSNPADPQIWEQLEAAARSKVYNLSEVRAVYEQVTQGSTPWVTGTLQAELEKAGFRFEDSVLESKRAPAYYEVHVHVDYPAWTGRPTSVRKIQNMVLKPGEVAQAWVQLQGIPQGEDSSVVRVRVVPRGAEEHRPGQIGTRSDEERALEIVDFRIRAKKPKGREADREAVRDLNREYDAFERWWKNWAKVHNVDGNHPHYNALFEEKLNHYFQVGTNGQRADVDVTRNPLTGELKVQLSPHSLDTFSFASRQAHNTRIQVDNQKVELLARVQEQPPSFRRSVMSALYTGFAIWGSVLVAAAYVSGMLRAYRHASKVRRYYRRLRREAAQLNLGRGAQLNPAGQMTQTFSMTHEEVIRVGSPGERGIPARPAMLHPGQQQAGVAMTAYGKHPVIVLDDRTQELSENIERTLVDPLGQSQFGRPVSPDLSQAHRAQFQQSAPRLWGLSILAGVAALGLGIFTSSAALGMVSMLGVVLAGAAMIFLVVAARSDEDKLQQAAGALMTVPARVAGSAALNHPVVTYLLGAAAIVGTVFLALNLAVPLTWVAIVTLTWAGIAIVLSLPELDRAIAAIGITGLGTVVLLALLPLSLPVLGSVLLSVATILITQRILITFLESELPMQGFLRGTWDSVYFVVRWGAIAAVVYWIVTVFHPWLWAGAALKLPFVGSAFQWAGLKAGLAATALGPVTWAVVPVAIGVGLNLANQVRMFLNKWYHRPAEQRDWFALLMGGIAIPAILIGPMLWFMGVSTGMAVIAYIGILSVSVIVGSGVFMLIVAGFDAVKGFYERVSGLGRRASDQRLLGDYNPALYSQARQEAADDKDLQSSLGVTLAHPIPGVAEQLSRDQQRLVNWHYWRLLGSQGDYDPALYSQARQEAADDKDLQRWQGVTLDDPPLPGVAEQLSRDQQRLVNWHYWWLLASQRAEAQDHYEGLSDADRQRLINLYFTELLKENADQIIGEDAGTAIRTVLPGFWTGRISEISRHMRNDDRLVVFMPALLLSLAWSWGRDSDEENVRENPFLWVWETFRILLVSFSVPLGFLAAMVNRIFGAMFFKGGNMGNTLRVRGDAGIKGYVQPFDFVFLIIGRWLVGHVHIMMRTYLGRMVTRNAADRLLTHRWQRKSGSVSERIEHFTREADDVWNQGDLARYRHLMGGALYAALAGEKNLYFDVGESETPDEFEELEWNADPDEDGLDDVTYFGTEWNQGTLAGVVAQRYYGGDYSGVHTYFPTKVERVRQHRHSGQQRDLDYEIVVDILSDVYGEKSREQARIDYSDRVKGRVRNQLFTLSRLNENQHKLLRRILTSKGGRVDQVQQVVRSKLRSLRTRRKQEDKALVRFRRELHRARDEKIRKLTSYKARYNLRKQTEFSAPDEAKIKKKKGDLKKLKDRIKTYETLDQSVVRLPNDQWAYYAEKVVIGGQTISEDQYKLKERLSPAPAKFQIVSQFAGHPKSRLADGVVKYFQGRVTPEPEFLLNSGWVPAAGMEQAPSQPPYRLRIRMKSEEDKIFPEIREARRMIQNSRNRLESGNDVNVRRAEGVQAADDMAVRRHERLLGATLRSAQDRVSILRGELGHDAYRSRRGSGYQFWLNFFGWALRTSQGRDTAGRFRWSRWLSWWGGSTALGLLVGFGSGSLILGAAVVVIPWLLAHFYGTLMTVSFIGLGVQDTILQGMKGHYQDQFLEREMTRFFKGQKLAEVPPAEDAEKYNKYAEKYNKSLRRGWQIISRLRLDPNDPNSKVDEDLVNLIANYPRVIHPMGLGQIGLADPGLVDLLQRPRQRRPQDGGEPDEAIVPNASNIRAVLARQMRDRILEWVGAKIGRDNPEDWRCACEALTRNTQMELAAVGNELAGIQYHRSRDPDVFRAGEENDQFAADGNSTLVRMMKGLGVPSVHDRSWASSSQGAFYAGVRMPSMMYSSTDNAILHGVVRGSTRAGFLLKGAAMDGDRLVIVAGNLNERDLLDLAEAGDLLSDEQALQLRDRVREEKKRLKAAKLAAKLEEKQIDKMLDSMVVELVQGAIGVRRIDVVNDEKKAIDVVGKPDLKEEPQQVSKDAEVIHQILPIEAYLATIGESEKKGEQGQTVNQFTLKHTHLQPDLEVVEEFMQEESRQIAEQMPSGLQWQQVNLYLTEREQRLGLDLDTFVRLRRDDQAWLNDRLAALRQQVGDEGQIHLSPARGFSENTRENWRLLRFGTILGTIIGGFFAPWLWAVTAAAWVLGLPPMVSGITSFSRWVRPAFLSAVAATGSLDPYSNEVVFLNVLYGATDEQVIRSRAGGFSGLNWSTLDGLHDSSRWRLSVGTYLFPGSTLARLPLWERGAALVHAPPVPLVAAVRLLEEPPWLAPISGLAGRLPTDAFELGESFAEDTLFGWINLHHQDLKLRQRPPTLNAFNLHKADYLFGQQELRKRDEATTRAIQLFKGMGIDHAYDHLYDHPLLRSAQDDPLREILRRSMGMEAFRRDEVAAAGARGAGTLPYGYTGFTASNLYSRRVGPVAAGDVRAYWEYRYYQELDSRLQDLEGRPLFFQTMQKIQREHQRDLPPRVIPGANDRDALLQRLLVDPFVALAQTGVRIAEESARKPGILSQSHTADWTASVGQVDPSLFEILLLATEDLPDVQEILPPPFAPFETGLEQGEPWTVTEDEQVTTVTLPAASRAYGPERPEAGMEEVPFEQLSAEGQLLRMLHEVTLRLYGSLKERGRLSGSRGKRLEDLKVSLGTQLSNVTNLITDADVSERAEDIRQVASAVAREAKRYIDTLKAGMEQAGSLHEPWIAGRPSQIAPLEGSILEPETSDLKPGLFAAEMEEYRVAGEKRQGAGEVIPQPAAISSEPVSPLSLAPFPLPQLSAEPTGAVTTTTLPVALEIEEAEVALARLVKIWGFVEQDEVRVAAVTPEAVRSHPALAVLIGQPLQMGRHYLTVVPEDSGQMQELVWDLIKLEDTQPLPVQVQDYGAIGDRALNLFRSLITFAGIPINAVDDREPLEGLGLLKILRKIVANLAGVSEEAIDEKDLMTLERILEVLV